MVETTEQEIPERWLFDLLNKVRGEVDLTEPLSILKRARQEGIPIDNAFVEALVARWRDLGESVTPPFLADFIASFCEQNPPHRILDPCAGLGVLLTRLVTKLDPHAAVGIEVSPRSHNTAREIAPDASVDWRLGDALGVLDELTESFDLIVGDLPIVPTPMSLQCPTPEGVVSVRDDLGHLILLKSCQRLAPGGIGFFIVTPRFLMKREAPSVYATLPRLGLHLDAVLALPRGTFRATAVETWLVVVRREAHPELFVGELTQQTEMNRPLVHNLQAHRAGKSIELGVLVDPARFVSVRSLITEREVQMLARQSGLAPVSLASLARDIKTARTAPAEPFQNHESAIYLPLIGRSPAVTSLTDLHIKPQNYLQIVLDPALANPVYVAHFFNSVLGQRVREGLMTGAFIPKIALKSLRVATLYLPDHPIQIQTLQVNTLISNSLAQLETLRRQLWTHPNRYKDVEKAALSLNRKDDYLAWVETLPYPLASILWACQAATRADQKVRHLLHFFEAYAQFTVAMLASGLVQDPAFEGRQTTTAAQKPMRASFGFWTRLCREYANRARQMMQEQDTRDKCRALFGNCDTGFFEMMTDRRIFTLLEEMQGYRNTWQGHGGNPTGQETQSRLAILQDRLAVLRGLIDDRYTTALLLLPGSTQFDEGLYYYEVQAVQGTRTPFAPREVVTRAPMSRGKLYVLHETQNLPVEVIPLLKIMDSPSAQLNTAYFYSRTEKGEAQWVSYQFSNVSTRATPEKEVQAALSMLVPIEKPPK